jgi:hypothetical protein
MVSLCVAPASGAQEPAGGEAAYRFGPTNGVAGVSLRIAIAPASPASGSRISVFFQLRNPGSTSTPYFRFKDLQIRFTDRSGAVRLQPGLMTISTTVHGSRKYDPGQTYDYIMPYIAGPPGSYFATASEDLYDDQGTHLVARLNSATIPFTVVAAK